ncbi:hypothetical protein Tco_0554234 [Tanacetum coccineum]
MGKDVDSVDSLAATIISLELRRTRYIDPIPLTSLGLTPPIQSPIKCFNSCPITIPYFVTNSCEPILTSKPNQQKLHSTCPALIQPTNNNSHSSLNPLNPPNITRKKPKFTSLKLIKSINGINPCITKTKSTKHSRKPSLHKTSSVPSTKTSSSQNTENTSTLNDDSCILRCNRRLSTSTTTFPPNHSTLDHEILKTIEVGIAIGYSMEVGTTPKRKLVKRLCLDNNLNFIGNQESKSDKVDTSLIDSLWGRQNYGFATKKAIGNSGGIVEIWDNSTKKYVLWDKLIALIVNFQGMSIVLDDFNVSWPSVVESPTLSLHPANTLKIKLQKLKKSIRSWRKSVASNDETLIGNLKSNLNLLDTMAENGILKDDDIVKRLSIPKQLEDLEHVKNLNHA